MGNGGDELSSVQCYSFAAEGQLNHLPKSL